MINGRNLFRQTVKNNLRTFDNIRKIATDQREDYIIDYLLDYLYFKNCYKMIAISKQQELDADPKPIKQINFTGNLYWPGNKTMLFITAETKEAILDFSQETLKALWMYSTIYFALIKYQSKMTHHNTLNAKLSNIKLNKLKSGIKNGTKVTLKLPSNVAADSNHENDQEDF